MVRNPFKDLSTADTEPAESEITAEHMKLVQELLMELWGGQMSLGTYMELIIDAALNNFNHEDFPALWRVRVQLAVKGWDLKLDVIFQSQITAMAGMLNLYLDPQLI